jgi:indolepyruvate ferredoxin oxidoreductase
VLALAGDDPGAKSSSIAHQSEQALIHCGIPILNPANVQDYLDLGLYGFALSRYSGCWVGFKCLTDTVESAGSVEVGPERVRVVEPATSRGPRACTSAGRTCRSRSSGGLFEQRLPGVQAFVRANRLDRVFPGRRRAAARHRHHGQGLSRRAPGARRARHRRGSRGGVRARDLQGGALVAARARGHPRVRARLEHLIVIEEKRPVIEEQLARLLFNTLERPRLAGKLDADGMPCVPNVGELTPGDVVAVLRGWLSRAAPDLAPRLRRRAAAPRRSAAGRCASPRSARAARTTRRRWCPRAASRRAGSAVTAWRVAARPPHPRRHAHGRRRRELDRLRALHRDGHIFQNLGDGTYFHSGLLAIRAAVAAGVHITYKILANGAVAMTGGSRSKASAWRARSRCPRSRASSPPRACAGSRSRRTSPRSTRSSLIPAGVTVHHRDELDRVQRDLRDAPGVSALIYDQTCAAEARRLRKRGEFPDPTGAS